MIIFPFNYNPDTQDYGSPARSYTCPANKHAFASITLSVSAVGSAYNAGGGGTTSSGSAQATAIKIELKAGDILAVTETPANTSSILTTESDQAQEASDVSICTVTVNGNEVARLETMGKASTYHLLNVASKVEVGGTAQATFQISEFTLE